MFLLGNLLFNYKLRLDTPDSSELGQLALFLPMFLSIGADSYGVVCDRAQAPVICGNLELWGCVCVCG